MEKPRFIFFGTPQLAVIVLEELKMKELIPSLIVTAPDKPAGRGLRLTQTPVKKWAISHGIPTIEPERYDAVAIARLKQEEADVCVLVAYGTILPKEVLTIAPHGILNVHPSLLPLLRGPSPVRTAILQDQKVTGVSIIRIDEKMDHGPLLAQEKYVSDVWPPDAQKLDEFLFSRGGALLADILPRYLSGAIKPTEQDHSKATYSSLFKKEDGLIDLTDDAYQNLLKIHAYAGWPGTYFFTDLPAPADKADKNVRIKILSAHIENDALILDNVIPEGGHAMKYADFCKAHNK